MCTVNVKQILENRMFPEAGSVLYDRIVEKIDSEDKIILDMNGVETIPSMFLNTSIGKFIDVYGLDLLKRKISFERISKSQADRLLDYIKRVANI